MRWGTEARTTGGGGISLGSISATLSAEARTQPA
jgi:hypothetical protein